MAPQLLNGVVFSCVLRRERGGGMVQIRAAVAGHPVHHSLTPALFMFVADHLRASGDRLRIELLKNIDTVDLSEAMTVAYTSNREGSRRAERGAAAPRREFWLSLTTPLKHMVPPESAIELLGDARQIACVNQMLHDGHGWRGAATDGIGLVDVARENGIQFPGPEGQVKVGSEPLLCLHGGGSTARSCASAWAEAGGSICWEGGRRALDQRGPWSNSLIPAEQVAGHLGRRLHIDFDVAPSRPVDSEAAAHPGPASPADGPDLVVSAAYGLGPVVTTRSEGDHLILDGRWLLAAQHLAAWRLLFRPGLAETLPGLSDAVEQLAMM